MRRRDVMIGGAAFATARLAHAADAPTNPRTIVTTELGSFTVEVYEHQAPITARNYLAYVDGGYLNGSTVYRIVAPRNQPDDAKYPIAVVQWGMDPAHPERSPFPPIPHETTQTTGLKHLNGTVSMARLGPGTASSAFFICIGDQPELDFGGHRNPDGQGFAAFAQVVEGMGVVRTIYGRAEDTGVLKHPITIPTVIRAR
ncbi:MAG: peptidylprolyl isomerase [Rhodospirillales bacterium]|nr:peptidylprolyl isomerase [Rhodospirillales bacterium]